MWPGTVCYFFFVEDQCAICWDEMESARKLPCGHLFHSPCLRSWLEQDTSCPTCRYRFRSFVFESCHVRLVERCVFFANVICKSEKTHCTRATRVQFLYTHKIGTEDQKKAPMASATASEPNTARLFKQVVFALVTSHWQDQTLNSVLFSRAQNDPRKAANVLQVFHLACQKSSPVY